jgi:hypothetical protein
MRDPPEIGEVLQGTAFMPEKTQAVRGRIPLLGELFARGEPGSCRNVLQHLILSRHALRDNLAPWCVCPGRFWAAGALEAPTDREIECPGR